jgi:hypothetical protein
MGFFFVPIHVVVRLCCALPFSLEKGDRSEWHFWITVYVDRARHILSHLFVIIYVHLNFYSN